MGTNLTRRRLEAALLNAIDAACAEPMRWGEDDCALWCAGVLRGALDYDPAADFRGRYRSRKGAHRRLGRGGLAGALRKVGKRHGWKVIKPAQAQVGDIGLADVIYEGKKAASCVICRSPGWFVGRNEFGITALPASKVRIAFKIAEHHRVKPPEFGHPVFMPKVRRSFKDEYTQVVVCEPVSTTIGLSALLFNTGLFASVGAAAAFGGAVASTVIGIGVSVGLNYAASALTQRGNQPLSNMPTGAPNDPSIRYNTRQAIPPKRIIYGTAQVGGALFFEETANPYLYQGILLCDKPITRFHKMWIGEKELTFAGGLVTDTILTPLAIDGQPSYSTRLTVSLRLGANNQAADLIIQNDFPILAQSPIPQGLGSTIGDMTGGGGLAAAFDGEQDAAANSASKTGTGSLEGFVGKDWGAPRLVTGFTIKAPTDAKFIGGAINPDTTFDFELHGSTDNFSADDDNLGHTSPVNINVATNGQSVSFSLPSITTSYRYHRIRFDEDSGASGSHTLYVAELQFSGEGGSAIFRQRGIATAVMKYHFGTDQAEFTSLWGQSQRPNPIFLVDGVAVPDPRRPRHILQYDPNDPLAVAEAEATWEFSNNAALCQAHYLIQPYGGRIDPRKINWDKVAEAADWDDGLIGTKEGTLIKRGTIDGVITLNQSPSDVLSSLLSANRGFVLESAGQVWVSSSKPRTSVATIHDAILSGGIDYRAAKPKRDLLNKLKVRFVAEDRAYQTVDGPILNRTDLQTADNQLLEGVLDLPFTLDHRRAQVLQKSFLQNARLGRRLSCVVDVQLLADASDELVGNTVTFNSELFPQFNGVYFVESWGFTDQFGAIQLSLAEYDPSIETDWNPTTDQQDFVVIDPNVN